MHHMLAFAGVSLMLLLAAPAALAASASLANKTYYSDIPNVSITLGKTSSVIAILHASCTVGTQVKQSWSADNVPLFERRLQDQREGANQRSELELQRHRQPHRDIRGRRVPGVG